MNEFISLREKRVEGIKEYLIYENLIEFVEGFVWYVEIKVFLEKFLFVNDLVLERYGKNLINVVEFIFNIRWSCYSLGLFMCLLLDELLFDWKESFLGIKIILFELIKFFDIVFWK